MASLCAQKIFKISSIAAGKALQICGANGYENNLFVTTFNFESEVVDKLFYM